MTLHPKPTTDPFQGRHPRTHRWWLTGLTAAVICVVWSAAPSPALEGYVVATGGSVTGIPDRVGSAGDLVLINCATRRDTVLRRGPLDCPCFSPGGDKIAFIQNGRIYTINADGTGLFDVIAQGGNPTTLSWAHNNYLYWSPSSDNRRIYRVYAKGGPRELVYTMVSTTYNFGNHLKMSRDATRAAWWYAGLNYNNALLAADLLTRNERYYGKGCMTTISPSGRYVCHNTTNHANPGQDSVPAHVEAWVRRFEDTVTTLPVRIVTEPEQYPNGYFNRHRFSQHSDSFIVFYTSPRKAWVCNVWNDSSVNVGNGLPFDYFPGRLNQPVAPSFLLAPDTITFNAVLGQSATSPAQIVVSVNNQVPYVALGTAAVEGSPSWLTATVRQGAQDSCSIVNTVALSSITQPGPLSGTVTLRVANADPQTRSYAVRLFVRSAQAPVVTSLEVNPRSVTVQEDEQVRFSSIVKDQHGNPLPAQPAVAWTVSGGGAIDSQGVFRPSVREGGPFTVTASHQGISATAQVRVQARALRVVSPNGGERLAIGQTMTVRFEADTQRIRSIVVEISVDAGKNWARIVASSVNVGSAQWGAFPWTIPDSIHDAATNTKVGSISSACLVRVADYSPTGVADESDGTFTIARTSRIVTSAAQVRDGAAGFSVVAARDGRLCFRIHSPGAYRLTLSSLSGEVLASVHGYGDPGGTARMARRFSPGTYMVEFRLGEKKVNRRILLTR